MQPRRPGPAQKPDALRRNPEYVREKTRRWRAANPGKCQSTRRRNEQSRAERYKQDPAGYLWRTAKYRANQLGVQFDIDQSDVIVPAKCPITGAPIDVLTSNAATGASIDRVNNSLGYVKGNVRVISRKANRMKGDSTIEDLMKLIAYMRGEI